MSHDDPTKSSEPLPLSRKPLAQYLEEAHKGSSKNSATLAQLVAGLGPGPGDSLIADLIAAESQYREEANQPATLGIFAAEWPEIINHHEACRAILMTEFAHLDPARLPQAAAEVRAAFPALADQVTAIAELCAAMAATDAGLAKGDQLGKYKLMSKLGEGSFGEVWQALDHDLGRYVALKLLRLDGGVFGGSMGVVGPGSLRRVMAEAQAAAGLDHPNVVRIHAAGRLPDGRAFIDAQLAGDAAPTREDPRAVAVGSPLDKIAKSAAANSGTSAGRGHGPRWAAQIMEQVVRGVAAAHARGVIHRDIKPANIILTPSGKPMLADFGLSALVASPAAVGGGSGGDVAAGGENRGPRVGITGTPSFMSPEQARGERATPASDVYSLGATLRYLLLGELPIVPSGKHSTHAQTDVIEQLRRGEISKIEGAAHAEHLPLPLIRIADCAMSIDPGDRYVSAEQMADDLSAWLARRPTHAGREGPGARLAMWYRRHVGVASVALLAAAVLIASTWRFVARLTDERDRAVAAEGIAENERKQAQRAARAANAVSEFMQETLTDVEGSAAGRGTTLLEAIEHASEKIPRATSDEPLVEADVRNAIGRSFTVLGEFDKAEANLKRAIEIRKKQIGPEARETMLAEGALAEMYQYCEHYAQGRAVAEPLIERAARVLGESDPVTTFARHVLGSIAVNTGQLEEGEKLLQRVLADRRAAKPVDELGIARTLAILGALEKEKRNREKAVSIFSEVLEIRKRILSDEHPSTIETANDLGSVLAELGRIDEAEPLLRLAHSWFEVKLGPKHVNTLNSGYNLAWMLLTKKKAPDEALVLAEPLAANAAAKLGNDHPIALRSRCLVGRCLAAQGNCEAALTILIEVADAAAGAGRDASPTEMVAARTAAECCEKLNRPEEAAKWKARSDQKKREQGGG